MRTTSGADGPASGSRGPGVPDKPIGGQACISCRRVKMRCRLDEGSKTCQRCHRRRTNCVFEEPKKRGRKSQVLDNCRVSSPRPAAAYSASGRSLRGNTRQRGSQEGGSNLRGTQKDVQKHPPWREASPGGPEEFTMDERAVGDEGHDPNQHEPYGQDFWSSTTGLQPDSLLGQQTGKDKSSLRDILSIRGNMLQSQNDVEPLGSPCAGDPIVNGIVTYHLATSLFEGFMKSLNPFVCLLDSSGLHTFQYVRGRSAFLLSAILRAAAKVFNPSIYQKLHVYTEKLYSEALTSGLKSTEVIQAIVLSTYWKEPEDTRSWSMMGYVIRLCMELGWHKLKPSEEPVGEHHLEPGHEIQSEHLVARKIRKRRNIERTWFILFVYDRSMSMQTGKPWMIECNDLIASVNTWYKKPFAHPNDATLAALVTLRLASADLVDAYNPRNPSTAPVEPGQADSMLSTLSNQTNAWMRHWLRITADREQCQPFLVDFFGTHLMLSLHSYPLQASISNPDEGSMADTEAFRITYASATHMLELVAQPALCPLLSFAHDSVHAMTAYAAGFLVKLLLSVEPDIRKEYESTAIEAIRAAQDVFSLQSAPCSFACALQAKFLDYIVKDYGRTCRRRLVDEQRVPQSCVVTDERSRDHQPNVGGSLEASATRHDGNGPVENAESTTALQAMSFLVDDAQGPTTSPEEWAFLNQDWTSLFTQSGFDFSDGNFVPI